MAVPEATPGRDALDGRQVVVTGQTEQRLSVNYSNVYVPIIILTQ